MLEGWGILGGTALLRVHPLVSHLGPLIYWNTLMTTGLVTHWAVKELWTPDD